MIGAGRGGSGLGPQGRTVRSEAPCHVYRPAVPARVTVPVGLAVASPRHCDGIWSHPTATNGNIAYPSDNPTAEVGHDVNIQLQFATVQQNTLMFRIFCPSATFRFSLQHQLLKQKKSTV